MSSRLQASHDLSDEYLDKNEFEEEESNESESSRNTTHSVSSTRSRSRPLSTSTFSPSKKTKLDDMFESRSTIASESASEDQEEIQPKKQPESVLTKTFRGQVIKSRR